MFSSFFPSGLVIIFDLHDLITFPEKSCPMLFFFFVRRCRIQILLQNLVQPFHTQCTLSHRGKHLYLRNISLHIFRQFFLYKCDYRGNNLIRFRSPDKQKIRGFIIQLYLFPIIYLMCIYDNPALCRLSENSRQHNNIVTVG